MSSLLSFPPIAIGCFGSLLAAAALPVFAQSPRAVTPSNASADGGEVVTLAEFNVAAVRDGSYDASDTLTGSRVRTQIRELPYALNVVTREFMQDFAAFDIAEELAYTSSFSPGQSTALDFNLRGITVSGNLRNGLRVENLRGSITTARVEVIKGPSAAVYGQSSPGGAINVVSTRPKTQREGNLRLSVGNYANRRGELELTGPVPTFGRSGPLAGIFKDTYYLFAVADYYREFEQDHAFEHQWQAAFTLLKKFGPDTSLTLETEYIIQHGLRELPLPYNAETIGGRQVSTGLAYDLFGFYGASPDGSTWRRQGGAFLTFEHRFSRGLSYRLAGNHSQSQNRSHSVAVGWDTALFNPRRLTGREPEHHIGGQYTWGVQSDLLATYRTGALSHRTLLTVDLTSQRGTRSTTRLQNTAAILNNPAWNVPTLFVDSPNYFLRPWTPADYPRIDTANDNRTEIYGAYLRHQATAMEGRLLALASVRYDYVGFDLADKRRPAAIVKDVYHNEAVTKQFGLNFKVNEPVMLYVNRAEAFVPPTSSGTTAINTGRRFLNERGLGYDAGVKLALFDGRLNANVGIFRIERRNVRVTELELVPVLDAQGRPVLNPATGQPQTTVTNVPLSAGVERSEGWEIDFNWKLTQSLQAFGGYGFADSFIVDAGRDLDAVGRPPRSVPRHQGGAGIRYAVPSSVVKGVTLTLGATYMGEVFVQSPLSGGIVGADGYIREHNGRRDVMAPSYTVWNAGATYRFRTTNAGGNRLEHRMQLNAKNLFDLKHINNRFRAAPGLTLIAGYGLTF